MKMRLRYVILFVTGLVILAIAGLLLAPKTVLDRSFLWGFTAATCIMAGIWAILPRKQSDSRSGLGLPALIMIVIVAAGTLFIAEKITTFSASKNAHFQNLEDQKEDEVEAIRLSQMSGLMGSTLEHVERELQLNGNGTLGDSTIERLAALSYSLKPTKSNSPDSADLGKLSIERGQLLLALLHSGADTSTLAKIYSKVTFAQADLPKANLNGAFLKGINLRSANLDGADLGSAGLDSSNMRGANLWGANMQGVHLNQADLRRAEMSWANLNDARMTSCNMNGVKLHSATLLRAHIIGATAQYADLSGEFLNNVVMDNSDLRNSILHRVNFNESSLTNSEFRRADFTGAMLTDTDLSKSVLSYAKMEDSNMTGSKLDSTIVLMEDWIRQLTQWNVRGTDAISSSYSFQPDSTTNIPGYRLVPNSFD